MRLPWLHTFYDNQPLCDKLFGSSCVPLGKTIVLLCVSRYICGSLYFSGNHSIAVCGGVWVGYLFLRIVSSDILNVFAIASNVDACVVRCCEPQGSHRPTSLVDTLHLHRQLYVIHVPSGIFPTLSSFVPGYYLPGAAMYHCRFQWSYFLFEGVQGSAVKELWSDTGWTLLCMPLSRPPETHNGTVVISVQGNMTHTCGYSWARLLS